MTPTRIGDLPHRERPRERLLSQGVDALSERELLALVLRNGRPGESALELAAALIAEFGGLSGIAGARPEELARRPGIGLAKAAALVAAFRLARLAEDPPASPVLRSAADIAAIAAHRLRGVRRERVLVLVCSGANRLQHVVASRSAPGAAYRIT
jgi:DNA repair protein RadC